LKIESENDMEIFVQSDILGFSLAIVAYSATIAVGSMKEIADATGPGKMNSKKNFA